MRKYDARRTWRHNSFSGQARMAQTNMHNMARADSLTPEAQELAERISQDCEQLLKLLKKRVD